MTINIDSNPVKTYLRFEKLIYTQGGENMGLEEE